jgi:hypothetical protein
MIRTMATKDRVYTALDSQVSEALELAVEGGLVELGASRSERLHALAVYAKDQLLQEKDLVERIAAYDEIAGDEERSAIIEASVLAAVEDGLL